MAVAKWVQTDTAVTSALAAMCSGLVLGTGTNQAKKATEAATAGITAIQVSLPSSSTRVIAVGFELAVGTGEFWGPGTWTVLLNVTTAQSGTSITWTDVFICRVNSSGVSQATIASKTALAIALSTTGVKTATVTGGLAQVPNAGDKVYAVLAFTNSSSSQARTFSFTPNQTISGPFGITGRRTSDELGTRAGSRSGM